MVMAFAPVKMPFGLNVTSRLRKLFTGLPSSRVPAPMRINPSYSQVPYSSAPRTTIVPLSLSLGTTLSLYSLRSVSITLPTVTSFSSHLPDFLINSTGATIGVYFAPGSFASFGMRKASSMRTDFCFLSYRKRAGQ